MTASLEVVVEGRWLSLDCLYGIDEISTSQKGSDQVSWTPNTDPSRRFAGGEQVDVLYGGYPMWTGNLSEPEASQEQLSAVGASYLAQYYAALDGSGNATDVPDTAIDQAITGAGRNLSWTRPASIRSTSMSIDISQGPVTLATMLDTYAQNNGVSWGVDSFRQVFAQAAPSTPTYQTLPMQGGLGYALDDYASTLVGRYINNSAAFATAIVTDANAEALHGHREEVVDLTGRGQISSTSAGNILASILARGKSTPQWTAPISLSYGEILTMGGNPVALESVSALGSPLLRIRGGYELTQRGNGQMYVDVPMGRTSLADGVLTVTAQQKVVKSIADLAEAAMSRKS